VRLCVEALYDAADDDSATSAPRANRLPEPTAWKLCSS
jgi:hypothetical protein